MVTATPVEFDGNRDFAEQLTKRGFIEIRGIVPNVRGVLDKGQLEQLGVLAESLTSFVGQQIYVVCHVYGSLGVDVLLERSKVCAQLAAECISEASGGATVPFGVGPMVPTQEATESRIELVVPSRLRSE